MRCNDNAFSRFQRGIDGDKFTKCSGSCTELCNCVLFDKSFALFTKKNPFTLMIGRNGLWNHQFLRYNIWIHFTTCCGLLYSGQGKSTTTKRKIKIELVNFLFYLEHNRWMEHNLYNRCSCLHYTSINIHFLWKR